MATDQYEEDILSESIEDKTAQIPSNIFLIASLAAMGLSLGLKCLKKNHTALFIGQWAAPFLLLGIYNKIVKTSGHDMEDE